MGRPVKYTLEELETLIEEYFKDTEVPNKAGIRLRLAISKVTYNEWKKKGHKFSNSIKRIDDNIEQFWVQRLNKPACTGAIFYLKNAFKDNYRDRYEQDVTSGGEKIQQLLVKYLDDKSENKAEDNRDTQ